MTDAAAGPLWSVPRDGGFLWERFGEVCLLFNPLSGSTHLLNELVIDILEVLQHGPLNLAGVIAALDLSADAAAVRPRVRQVLAEMDRLGLVRPVDR